MGQDPHVSIVIPTFSRPVATRRALDSVVAQTFTDFEVIVVDDGSPDQATDYLKDTGIERLTFMRHPMNRGPAAARNTGIGAAKGRWIAFLDSDDTWKAEKLAHQLGAMERPGATEMACATGYYLHKDGRALTVSLNMTPDTFRREILFGCTISPGTTLLVRKSVFDDIGLFDENLRRLEDWDWLLRFAKRYDMAFVAEPLADIHLQTSQSAYLSEKADPVLASIRAIRKKHIPRLESRLERAQLRSALLVESAAHMYRSGRAIPAAAYVVAAFVIYPYRNASFFRTLWRSLVSLWRR